jgi:predicted nucleotidyltransferase
MPLERRDFSNVFRCHAKRMEDVCRQIFALPGVRTIILFGSYAKGDAEAESDIDLAVFFDAAEDCLIEQYRELSRICANPEVDIQAQPFHTYELLQPCGIIDEVVSYGVELRV